MKAACSAGSAEQAVLLPGVRRVGQQPGTDPAVTPAQTASLVAHPASIVSLTFSLVMAVGVRMIDWTVFPPGVLNGVAVSDAGAAAAGRPLGALIAFGAGLAQSWTATLPAVSPRAKAFFQTDTVCVPRATRFSAAVSPSWPETGTLRPTAVSAWTTPVAMLSFSDRTASILFWLALSAASMLFFALVVSQLSVFFSKTTFTPAAFVSLSFGMPASVMPERRKAEFGSVSAPRMTA